MQFFRIPPWIVPFALWMGAIGLNGDEPVRIAMASDPSLANLVDIVTADLSTNNNLAVLDRAALDKVGAEQALQKAVGTRDYTGLGILPADGLILLRSAGGGESGVYARLVAVQPGVVLREVALPETPDPATRAKAIVDEFAPYWPKLGAIRRGNAAPYSLLGLRFDIDSPERRLLERQFNILLASRLSAEPNCVVLERWRLNDALFERSIHPQHTAPFWTGSSLIDGSLQERDGTIVATLRIRSPKEAEVTITDEDTPVRLPDLVGRLADKLRQNPSGSVAWKPAEEADHFAKLSQWCLDNRLFEEGAGAAETALALGDDSRAMQALQVRAYAMEAYPDDLAVYNSLADNYRLGRLQPDTLPQRVVAASRAALLARTYLKANRDFSADSAEDPVNQGLAVLNTCLRVLWAAYDFGLGATHPDETTDLRHEVQGLLADLGDELIPQAPSHRRGFFLDERALYAGLWNNTAADTLAFYRQVLKPGEPDGAWIRRTIFEAVAVRGPYLEGDVHPNPAIYPTVNPPWVAAWDASEAGNLRNTWKNFISELAGLPSIVAQADALKCELSSDASEADRSAVLARFIAFLQQHTDALSDRQGEELAAGIEAFDWVAEKGPNGPLRDQLVALYQELLTQRVSLAPSWIEAMPKTLHFPGDVPVLKILLSNLSGYETWCRSKNPPDGDAINAIERARQEIYLNKPELEPPPKAPIPEADFLNVNHFCAFWASDEDHQHGQVSIEPFTSRSDGKNIWFLTYTLPHRVFCIDPETGATVASYPIPAELDPPRSKDTERYRDVEVSDHWIAVAINEKALICSRADGQWRALDLPPSSYMPRWVGDDLYLLYNARFGDRVFAFNTNDGAVSGSGVYRVTLPVGSSENLIASRRVPPQNPLDGEPLGKPLDMWMDAAGLNVAFENLPVYASPVGKNAWTPVTVAPARQRLRAISGGALMNDGFTAGIFGTLRLMTGHGDKVLLSDQVDGKKEAPVWNFPPGLDGHHFPYEIATYSPVMRGEDLCFYLAFKRGMTDGRQDCLYYFAKGRKDGVRIPLAFDMEQMYPGKGGRFAESILMYNSLMATDYGLVIGAYARGFWVIPWSDIDAYLGRTYPEVRVGPITPVDATGK